VRRRAALLGVAVLVAGAAVFVLRERRPSEEPAITARSPTQRDEPPVPPAPSLAGAPEDPSAAAAPARDEPPASDRPPDPAVGGVVLDPRGQPFAGAIVGILAEGAPGTRWEFLEQTPSAADGRFHFVVPAPGDYHLEIAGTGPHVPVDDFPVRAPDTDVRVALKAGREVTLTVTDSDGRPVAGAVVRCSHDVARGKGFVEVWEDATKLTDARGRVVLEALDPDRSYALEIRDVDGRFVPERRPWRPRDETLRMRRSLSVRGRAVTAEGTPVEWAHVHAKPGGAAAQAMPASAVTARDGTFHLLGLPEGEATLYAEAGEGDERLVAEPLPVKAGDPDVRLVLRPEPRGEFVVRFAEWPREGGPAPTLADLTEVKPDGKPGNHHREQVAEGVVVFRNVRYGKDHVLFAATPHGARIAHERVVPAKTGLSDVALRPAASVRVRLSVSAEAKDVSIWAAGLGVNRGTVVSGAGDHEIRGLPEGEWTVGASARVGAAFASATATAKTGDVVDLVLEPPVR
jgi:hypothetical protein